MKVLVACEFSGRVRNEFLKRGHDAYSCDYERYIGWVCPYKRHLRQDVTPLLKEKWDLVIAHPPCTYLCNSGVRWLHERTSRWEKMKEACIFFMECLTANADRICVENPIQHGYAQSIIGERPTQIIHPWQFGDPEQKATCLWLLRLPLLSHTNVLTIRHNGVHTASPSVNRWKVRSITSMGIAKAMADQWDY